MTTTVKFPSGRQPAVEDGGQGTPVFTRVWFLFFQMLYQRTGDAVGISSADLKTEIEGIEQGYVM